MQSNAQYLSPDWSCNTHCGFATVSGHVSVGHPPEAVHFGAQKAPGTPEMVTFASPVWQLSVLNGSSYSQVAFALIFPKFAFESEVVTHVVSRTFPCASTPAAGRTSQ